jgi:hypothetical protein
MIHIKRLFFEVFLEQSHYSEVYRALVLDTAQIRPKNTVYGLKYFAVRFFQVSEQVYLIKGFFIEQEV